jgi:hypothetical protein
MNLCQVIDHRRLAQDVYDKRTLHHLLDPHPKGVPASPDGRIENGRHRKATGREHSSPSKIVRPVWHDVEDERQDRPEHQHKNDRIEEKDGRYGIERQDFKKKRKSRRHGDVRPVFTDEEDTDNSVEIIGDGDGLVVEDLRNVSKREILEGRRLYWSSKGMGKSDLLDSA